MTISPIPQELSCLSEIELRLISRIKPFIKLLHLGGRYGQQGFKGQGILFAQQVEELAERLPLSGTIMGFTIVTESLDNVTINRRYTVDIERIKKAFMRLVCNNHLYKNVQINFEINEEELHQSILQAITISEPLNEANVIRTPENNFQQIHGDINILLGNFHQGDERFGSMSGRQCTGIAAADIAYSKLESISQWNMLNIDRVLLLGKALIFHSVSVTFN